MFFHAPKDSAVFRVAERYNLTPRLATVNPEALDAFVECWVKADQNREENLRKAQRALQQEFDIDRLALHFQSAFV